MSQPPPSGSDIQSILAALGKLGYTYLPVFSPNCITAAQRPAGGAAPAQPGAPGQSYPPAPGTAQPSYQAPSAPGYAPPGHGLPAPASSGNLDLSAIKPVNSGTMNFNDIISKARAYAAEKGVTSYDRPLVYNNEGGDADRYENSRSRTPPRDDRYNDRGSYRDDRRGGRGQDRDRSYSPGPRNRGGFSPHNGGRDRSPLRGSGGGGGGGGGSDENSETIQIESSLVGLIIGRQGENLRRIESESTCRVQFLGSNDGGPFRQCKISGPRHRRAEVKAAIDRIIDDSGMGPLNRAQEKPRDQTRAASVQLRDGEDHMQIMVPDRTVGLIIGRGGETIRDLQERSGCHINIVGESKSVNGLRPVNLIGSREAAAKAKDAILEIVDSDNRGEAPANTKRQAPPQRDDRQQRDFGGGGGGGGGGGHGGGSGTPDKINDSVMVPSDAVGMIIGKGGETIREMQNQTGCKVNVAQSSGQGETEREISLIGSREAIARAKAAIEEKVEAVVSLISMQVISPSCLQIHSVRRAVVEVVEVAAAVAVDEEDIRITTDHHTNPTVGPAHPLTSLLEALQETLQTLMHNVSFLCLRNSYWNRANFIPDGGYQNYVALWYQSMMYQQQQQDGQGAPPGAAPPAP